MKLMALAALLTLFSCSRGDGVYYGVTTDVSWEGYIFKSCEITLKTSAESSHQEFISSKDKALCDKLMGDVGKAYSVKWSHKAFELDILSSYLITDIKEKN